jgi:hypothetical protein
MAAGATYAGFWGVFEQRVFGPSGFWLYLACLLPVRIAEWWFLIWLFYDRKLREPAKGWRMVGLCTVWSYVLDLPAIAGFFVTAGFWIC